MRRMACRTGCLFRRRSSAPGRFRVRRRCRVVIHRNRPLPAASRFCCRIPALRRRCGCCLRRMAGRDAFRRHRRGGHTLPDSAFPVRRDPAVGLLRTAGCIFAAPYGGGCCRLRVVRLGFQPSVCPPIEGRIVPGCGSDVGSEVRSGVIGVGVLPGVWSDDDLGVRSGVERGFGVGVLSCVGSDVGPRIRTGFERSVASLLVPVPGP